MDGLGCGLVDGWIDMTVDWWIATLQDPKASTDRQTSAGQREGIDESWSSAFVHGAAPVSGRFSRPVGDGLATAVHIWHVWNGARAMALNNKDEMPMSLCLLSMRTAIN